MTDTLTQEQIDALKLKCENAIENEEVSQAIWPLSEQDTSEVQTTVYAHDVLELIKEVDVLRKASSWNFNVNEAPKDGTKLVVLDSIGDRMTAYWGGGPFRWKSDDTLSCLLYTSPSPRDRG